MKKKQIKKKKLLKKKAILLSRQNERLIKIEKEMKSQEAEVKGMLEVFYEKINSLKP